MAVQRVRGQARMLAGSFVPGRRQATLQEK